MTSIPVDTDLDFGATLPRFGGGILLDAEVSPLTPSSGQLLYTRGGRIYARQASGEDTEVGIVTLRRQMAWQKDGGANTVSSIGIPSPTLSGTRSSQDDGTAAWMQCATGATAGTLAGWTSGNYTTLRPDWAPMMFARIKTDASTTANSRYWIAMASADISTASSPGTIKVYGFRYDTNPDNASAFWRTVTGDGSTNTTTITSVPVTIGTVYDLRIEVNSNNTAVRYLINDQVVQVDTAPMIAPGTLLSPQIVLKNYIASSRSIYINKMVLTTNG